MAVLMLEELNVDLDDTAPKAGMIETLMADLEREHEAHPPVLIETHISWIILQGDSAWKIKKPVDLGFLDFSSLEKRHQACLDELRLNRRLAADIYLDVIPVTRTWGRPRLNGEGEILDYAVHMRRFDPDQGLDRLLARGDLPDETFDGLARQIAEFHAGAARISVEQAKGRSPVDPALENLPPLAAALADDPDMRLRLKRLEHWTRQQAERLQAVFAQRLADGFVRECHGDLHLGNMVLYQGRPLIFDCIEFSPALRRIDVISDLAFLLMDLDHQDRPDLAWRVLNGYLEETGDYPGLALLDFYRVYRALVRAKVNAMRLAQPGLGTAEADDRRIQCLAYIERAESYIQPRQGALLITCGLSGSGKTWYSRRLSRRLGAVHLRSDIERKRLHGLKPLAPSTGMDIYTREASERTFARLRELAGKLLLAGYTVIVDATFIDQETRDSFRQLAREHALPFLLLLFETDMATLERRIQRRRRAANDASEADLEILSAQRRRFQRPAADEAVIRVTGKEVDSVEIEGIRRLLQRQAGARKGSD